MTPEPTHHHSLSRRHFLRLSAGVTASAAFGGLLAACGRPDTGPTEAEGDLVQDVPPDAGGILRVAREAAYGSAELLDPASPNRHFESLFHLYNGLVRPGEDFRPAPALAESWEANDSADVWTFRLRPNVQWHDGSSLTSQDVKYSIVRNLDEELGSAIQSILEQLIAGPDVIETPDDLTVAFHLSSPSADFVTLLQAYQAYIIKEGSGDTVGTTGIGTGPFKVREFEPNGTTVLEAHSEYWEGPPLLDEIHLISIADAQGRANALLAGQVDVIDAHIGDEGQRLLADREDFTLQEFSTGRWVAVTMDTTQEPFDDARVRAAIKRCVDPQRVIDTVVQGNGDPAGDNPVPLQDPYRLDEIRQQSIEQAVSLLEEAGYPDGVDIELISSGADPMFGGLSVSIQELLAEANIRVAINQWSADTYWTEVWGQKPFYLTAYDERPAELVLNIIFHSDGPWNETKWANSEFDERLSAAKAELDFDARRALYQDAQRILMDDGGAVIPFFVRYIRGMSGKVKDLPARNNPSYHEVYLEEA